MYVSDFPSPTLLISSPLHGHQCLHQGVGRKEGEKKKDGREKDTDIGTLTGERKAAGWVYMALPLFMM